MDKPIISCFICGQDFCEEDSDHSKMTYEQFHGLMSEKAGYCIEIANLKSKVRRTFLKMEKRYQITLNEQINNICLLIDKLHFWHLLDYLPTLKDVEAAVFGLMLTKVQMTRLVCLLMNNSRNYQLFPAFPELFSQLQKFKRNTKKHIEKNAYGQLFQVFALIIQREQKAKKQINYDGICPADPYCDSSEQTQSQVVQIAGIPFNTQRTSLDLSILQLNDQFLAQILPALQKLRNIKQFRIRNSNLSKKGYQMLLNTLPILQSIDLSQNDSDNFLEKLITKQTSLKSLYLNETRINSAEKIQTISQNFSSLKVLHLNNNNIQAEMLTGLLNRKSGLFYLSMKDNQINYSEGKKIEVQFSRKGGYFEI